jgi:hypothetical protein
MTHEPDYHAVPGEEGMEEGVPSSFYGEQGEKTKKRSRLLRRSYVFRRRLAVCSFVMAGTLLSLFIAIKRGHLLRKFHSKRSPWSRVLMDRQIPRFQVIFGSFSSFHNWKMTVKIS